MTESRSSDMRTPSAKDCNAVVARNIVLRMYEESLLVIFEITLRFLRVVDTVIG